jgi:hypothetical protein
MSYLPKICIVGHQAMVDSFIVRYIVAKGHSKSHNLLQTNVGVDSMNQQVWSIP